MSERAFEEADERPGGGGGGAREVNASETVSTGLRLVPFSDYHPRRLHHAEAEGPLTLNPRGAHAAAGAVVAAASPGEAIQGGVTAAPVLQAMAPA